LKRLKKAFSVRWYFNPFLVRTLPTQAVVDGSRGAFFVTVIAEKSNYTVARQKMHPLHHHKLAIT
jgi:hypothetical protein